MFEKFCSLIGFASEVDRENASQCNPLSVSVTDSSPAHGESQDEVLRRRHGDKEVNFLFKPSIHKLHLTDNVLVKRAELWMRKSYILHNKGCVT